MICLLIASMLCAGLLLIRSAARSEAYGDLYDPGLSIMYNYLPGTARAFFERLYEAVLRGESHVGVPEGMSRKEAEWVLDFVWNEAPELCAFER